MSLMKKKKDSNNCSDIPKELWLEYHIQVLVSSKTGFEVDDIEMLLAEKTQIKTYNEFNSFIFKYRGKKYKLLNDTLFVISKY